MQQNMMKSRMVDRSFIIENDTYDVEVDFWENQRYKPLQGGWGVPYMGGIAPFSNLNGSVPVDFENLDKFACLPPGWTWIHDSWHVDLPNQPSQATVFSTTRGEVDESGWSYGTSFESLMKQTQDRILQAERSTLNTARRRRWVRTRRCIDPQARKIESYRRQWIFKLTQLMDTTCTTHSKLGKQLQEYHSKFRRSSESVIKAGETVVTDSLARLSLLQSKLKSLKLFLRELAAMEETYANRLCEFADRWKSAGSENTSQQQQTEDENARYTSFSTNVSYSTSNNGGFFEAVTMAQLAVATQKQGFAQTLSTQLPEDLDKLLQEILDLRSEREASAEALKGQILVIITQNLDIDISRFRSCLDDSVRRCAIERLMLKESLLSASVAWDYVKHGPGLPVLNPELVEIPSLYSPPTFSAVSGASVASNGVDPFRSLLSHAQGSLQVQGLLLLYHAEAKLIQKKSNQLCAHSSDLLKALLKLLVHGQLRGVQEALSMLSSIGMDADIRMKQSSNSLDKQGEVWTESVGTAIGGAGGQQQAALPSLEPLKVSERKVEEQQRRIQNQLKDQGLEQQQTDEEEAQLVDQQQQSQDQPQDKSSSSKTSSSSSLPPLVLTSLQALVAHVRAIRYNLSCTSDNTSVDSRSSSSHGEWKEAWLVLTYDRGLHLLHRPFPTTDETNSSTDSNNSSSDAAAELWSYLSDHLDQITVICSVSLAEAKTSPLFLSQPGLQDSFLLTCMVDSSSLSAMMTMTTSSQSSSSSLFSYVMGSSSTVSAAPPPVMPAVITGNEAGGISSIMIAARSAQQAAEMMTAISCAFAPIKEQAPDEYAASIMAAVPRRPSSTT